MSIFKVNFIAPLCHVYILLCTMKVIQWENVGFGGTHFAEMLQILVECWQPQIFLKHLFRKTDRQKLKLFLENLHMVDNICRRNLVSKKTIKKVM